MNNASHQITELELLVMEHERLLEQFSDLIRNQQTRIDGLEKQLLLLQQKLSHYEQPEESGSGEERPPHY